MGRKILVRFAGPPVPASVARLPAKQRGAVMQTEHKYWFPAKRYGWGWGLPNCWQGWLVLAVFVGLVVVGSFIFPPRAELGLYLACIFVLCALLVALCWLKGEPPRWRWRNDAGS